MPLKELQAAVEGLLFLAAEGPEEELFSVQPGGEEVAVCVDTYVSGPPCCTYGLRVPVSCVLYVPAAQGIQWPTVRTLYAYLPRVCRTYRVPWHHRPYVPRTVAPQVAVSWPEPLFPFLLVNMGSGVSIVRVDDEEHFARVGGTACGGATRTRTRTLTLALRSPHSHMILP